MSWFTSEQYGKNHYKKKEDNQYSSDDFHIIQMSQIN